MLKILCVCANGMGTSTILKLNIKKIAQENNLKVNVDSCSFGEALAYVGNSDIIVTSPDWADQIPKNDAKMVIVKNLVDKKEVGDGLLDAVRTYFPDKI